MALIADCLSASERTFAAGIAADRETQKRAALAERDGHLDFNGQRCSPCVDCGRVFTASGLRLTRDANARLLCRRCFAQAEGVRYG